MTPKELELYNIMKESYEATGSVPTMVALATKMGVTPTRITILKQGLRKKGCFTNKKTNVYTFLV